MDMTDYDPLLNLPSGTGDISAFFRTGRGSTYAHHADSTTTRNRSGANHTDKSTGVQGRSGKTVFIDPKAADRVAGIYQNPEMATRLVPEIKDGRPTGNMQLQLMEDYGPRKAGSVLETVPYKLHPEVGLNPVEVWGSESPMGSSGRNIHFGNAITEVHPRPARLGPAASKLGIAGLLAGAAGASNAAELGDAAISALPAQVQALLYSKGAGEGEDTEIAYRNRMQAAQERGAANRGQAFDPRRKDLNIALPDDYRKGGRVRII